MNQFEAKRKTAEKPVERTLLLNIPPRYQWDHANGFCGEASIQCIGMFKRYFCQMYINTALTRNEVSIHDQNLLCYCKTEYLH